MTDGVKGRPAVAARATLTLARGIIRGLMDPALEPPLPQSVPARGPAATALALVVVSVIAGFLAFLLSSTEGHFVPQILDLYLVAQYARAMAEGHPFQYNPGEAVSTGSTSVLYTAYLAVAHALGARGEGLIAFAILTGAACYAACVVLARRIGRLLGGEREGWLSGALVALGGPVVWGFLYGSDIALFMLLFLWLLERLLREWDAWPARGSLVAATLLALARPEGLPIALILGIAWTRGPARRRSRAAIAQAWVPAAAGLVMFLLSRALGGGWLGSSFSDKSLLANYGVGESLALVAEYAIDVLRGLLLGFYPSQASVGFSRGWAPYYFMPLALVFVLLALVQVEPPWKTPLRLWATIAAAVSVLMAPNVFMGVHFNRYLMWAFPGLHVLAAVGLGTAARMAARGDRGLDRRLFMAGSGLAIVLGLLSTTRFAALYGEMAGEIYRRDVATAQWISRNLPRGVAMANIATSVEYLTGHRNLNLHGVTSPAFFGGRTAEREAGMVEALSRLPVGDRPPYLITSVATQENSPVLRELVQEPPLFRSSSLSDDLLIYRTRYDLVGTSARPYLPDTLASIGSLRETDRLNVCDTRDEAAHGYAFRSRLGDLRLHGTVRIAPYDLPGGSALVMDAGRAILGSESFHVRTSRDRDLLLVMRTAPSVSANVLRTSGSGAYGIEIPEAGLVVEAGGAVVARSSFHPRPGWDEHVLRIPGRFLRDGETDLRLSGRYASFFYWSYQ